MTCSRCRGLMVEDRLLDIAGSLEPQWVTSWRCVNCGHIHDAVIAHNRLVQKRTIVMIASGKPERHDDEARFDMEPTVRVAAGSMMPDTR